jgi:beta-glucosidase
MIVFFGDSITEWWNVELFNLYFGKYKPFNLGVSGHTTKDTLKHVEKYTLSYCSASAIILQIGTNDADKNITTMETFQNISRICANIFKTNPTTRIILVGPLPRGPTPSDKYRIYNKEVNKLLCRCDKDSRITYLDIGHMFLDEDGTISPYIMYDLLHLTKSGYNILSSEIANHLSYFFGEAPAPLPRLS